LWNMRSSSAHWRMAKPREGDIGWRRKFSSCLLIGKGSDSLRKCAEWKRLSCTLCLLMEPRIATGPGYPKAKLANNNRGRSLYLLPALPYLYSHCRIRCARSKFRPRRSVVPLRGAPGCLIKNELAPWIVSISWNAANFLRRIMKIPRHFYRANVVMQTQGGMSPVDKIQWAIWYK